MSMVTESMFSISFDSILAEAAANSAEYAKKHSDADDYVNPENGLIYCGKCHVPKQCVIKNIRTGKNMTVNCICRCEADISKEKSKKREEEQLAKIKENCKMPGIFWNADFSEIEDEKKRTNAVNYFRNFDSIGSSGLLLYGNVGTGKSFMAACIANALINAKHSVRWLHAAQIVEMSGFFNENEYETYLSSISRPDLLIIDDLGSERGTDYAIERVHTLIDYRISIGKPMIVTTNLELSEMQGTTDLRRERTYDRIFKACFPIGFHGKSYRQKQARENFAKMNELLNEKI